ncbi:MAG: Gamma-D-glutamyl-L-diamino acid endopeptidase 1 [Syntrophorhabdus sp. PtaB.Bin027]|nr:MAG: Gamma-D-glutamyl-L-diamino acid endopeptidase 1 [Syntrophorhabdus sp. PtaB.Bin027]
MASCPLGSQQYVIRSGDTYSKLAQMYGVSVSAIISLNPGIDPNNLQIGHVICIPTTTTIVEPSEEYPAQPYYPYTGYYHHTISQGETLWVLSRRYNIPVNEIIRHNPRIDHMHLRRGQIVHIPHK